MGTQIKGIAANSLGLKCDGHWAESRSDGLFRRASSLLALKTKRKNILEMRFQGWLLEVEAFRL